MTETTAQPVAAICRHLDGLPLAIELAAAQSAVLSPVALLARIQERLPLPVAAPRNAPERLRTMHNAVAWSYGLLSRRGAVAISAPRRLCRRLHLGRCRNRGG